MTTIWETETWRLVVEPDEYPEQPYDDGSVPIISAERDWYGDGGFKSIRQLKDITSYRLPDDIVPALSYFSRCYGRDRGLELWGRYLHIYHDVPGIGVMERDGTAYLAIAPRHWRDAMGLTDEHLARYPDVAEGFVSFGDWAAYLDGDVYVACLQELVTWTSSRGETFDRWETTDAIGGFYGHAYACEGALEHFGGPGESA
jgi:hypothetical protein